MQYSHKVDWNDGMFITLFLASFGDYGDDEDSNSDSDSSDDMSESGHGGGGSSHDMDFFEAQFRMRRQVTLLCTCMLTSEFVKWSSFFDQLYMWGGIK